MSRCRIAMLSKEEIEQIHSASLRILEKTGVVVNSKEARTLLREGGVEVDEDEGKAFMTEDVVKEALRSTAKDFVLGARNPKQDLRIPNPRGFPYLSTDGYPVQILDSDTFQKRPTVRGDLQKWACLADSVGAVDFLWPSTTPTDMPPQLQFVAGLRTSYENTTKHVQYQAINAAQAKFQIEMANAVAGSEKENRKRPHFSSVQCVVAPLQFDGHPTEAAIEFARAGIPIVAMSMVTPGMTGPVSLAGSVALANAEVLASVVISNTASKGARVFYCFVCAPLDMKTGNFVMGSPEYPVLEIAGTELARFYGIPSMMSGMGDTGKTAGFQLGMEKGFTTTAVALSGCDLLTGIGGLNDTSFVSMEQMLLDAEVWESVRRTWEGMQVDNKEIALEVIEKVGPKGQFLNSPHTFANFRRLYTPVMSDWSGYAAWDKAGRKDIFMVAQQEVRRRLASHTPEPLSAEVAEKLAEIERRAEAALA